MSSRHTLPVLALAAFLLVPRCSTAASAPLVAYSLGEAERRMKRHQGEPAVESLGGITRLLGVVIDAQRRDVVLVGQAAGTGRARLDDLAVALRALFVHRQWPLVSIDRMPDPQIKIQQAVRFEGGIADTQFGKDLLDADILLKKLSLGESRRDAGVGFGGLGLGKGLLDNGVGVGGSPFSDSTLEKWGFPSYFALVLERAKQSQRPESVNTRFWFHPQGTRVMVRPGVALIRELQIAVHTEATFARSPRQPSPGPAAVHNEPGEQFAASITRRYEDLAAACSAVGRLKPLLDLVAIAHALESLQQTATLQYWLTEYPVTEVKTPRRICWRLGRQAGMSRNGRGFVFEVSGGVRLRTSLQRLEEEGDITAIRDLVVMSRPKGDPLVRKIPLEGRQIPGCPERTETTTPTAPALPVAEGQPIGCNLTERTYQP